ncbi:RNA polymerase sigma factor [Altericista sp. CCNU0014]|uniref:RNA polymerase sigma factor n=1 Tax=Altericista sp. CCNU0014 TaxID=3082949 RepID=UPI0038517277
MPRQERNQEQDWQELIQKELDGHGKLIERLLIQMSLCGRYERGDILSQLFISFHSRVKNGGIKIEYENEETIVFSSRNREGDWKRILFIKAYLRTMARNYLYELFNRERMAEVPLPTEILEYLETENHLNDSNSSEDDSQLSRLKYNLDLLGYEDQRILELFFFENLSYSEIAQCLKSSGFPPDGTRAYNENNLRKKKQRALEKLRKLY